MNKSEQAQLEDLKKAFAAADVTIAAEVKKALEKAGMLVERSAKMNLTNGRHIASGLLRASVSHRLIEWNKIPACQIGTNVKCAQDMEFGGPPRHVPIDDLINWVRRKGLVGNNFAKNATGRRFKRGSEHQLAYLIQRKIAKVGTRPHPFLVPALLQNRAQILQIVKNGVILGVEKSGHK